MSYFGGKVILITGASSGIGKALAEQLAAPNVTLILTARRTEELKTVSQICKNKGAVCSVFYLDMGSTESIDSFAKELVSKYSCVDVLINNAGISQRSLAEETVQEVDRRIMEVNFFGPVYLTKKVFPLLLKSAKAQIVLMSSLTGTFGFPLRSAYAASKHAIEGFFQSWMLENKHDNVSFTVIAPGRIFTNISYSALQKDGKAQDTLDDGQKNGISAEACAQRIINAIIKQKRKIYIVKSERVLLFFHKYFPSLFILLVKKLNLK